MNIIVFTLLVIYIIILLICIEYMKEERIKMEKVTYVFSGFSVEDHFGKEVSKIFKKDLKNCKNIIFIPGGMGKNSKTDKYVNTDVEWFKEIGINIENVDIFDIDTDIDTIEKKINNADIIFLMGGDTIRQFEFISELNILKKIKEFQGAVIGVSAGAINLGKTSICSKDIDDGVEYTKIYDGIGRIGYTFEPHFEINNEELLKNELFSASNKFKIYGITNETALKISDGGQIEIIKGDLYIINKGKVSIVQ